MGVYKKIIQHFFLNKKNFYYYKFQVILLFIYIFKDL